MKKALLLQNSVNINLSLESFNVSLAFKLNDIELVCLNDDKFKLDQSIFSYRYIIVDQLAFRYRGLSYALEIEAKTREQKSTTIILAKSKNFNKSESQQLIDSKLYVITKPLLAYNLSKKLNSLGKS